ncbi:hypothetical protein DAPPUDRAFT_327834 [Daphnia pulex]|uniref:Uncharacterized protein n=1 Tax=Daphnia pulex TaxID=6669 RepID=E9HBX8_DAPPU|nr:hypothetical protein DAPPUDRAFT_327834 [Daphnia pulex]|eukprot:EFX70664.1 hypothetical protein DAPPUDRAFT_327834 [Daphnia pulex]
MNQDAYEELWHCPRQVSASNNPKIKICLTLLELLKETPIPVLATTQASA